MNKEDFLEKLHSLSGWENMTRGGDAEIHLNYKGVDFLIYRNDVSHYLEYEPSNKLQVAIVKEFNSLMEGCREELKKELEDKDYIRLTQDANEGDRN